MELTLSLMMDMVVLTALAVTIYYAVRLSRSLAVFRQYRQEFSNVLGQLSHNIDQANAAILGMKEASRSSGEHLQELIDQSRLLADELDLINQSADGLAGRLESLAEKNRKIVKGQDIANDGEVSARPKNGRKKADAVNGGVNGGANGGRNGGMSAEEKAFFIQDRDFGADDQDSFDEAGIPEELQSQAERELFKAIQKSGKV